MQFKSQYTELNSTSKKKKIPKIRSLINYGGPTLRAEEVKKKKVTSALQFC